MGEGETAQVVAFGRVVDVGVDLGEATPVRLAGLLVKHRDPFGLPGAPAGQRSLLHCHEVKCVELASGSASIRAM